MRLPNAKIGVAQLDHHKLVLPEFLNHDGSLFGGYLLKWIDEFAFISANLEYRGHRFVTVALDDVVFKHRIAVGEILRFSVTRVRLGNTSVQYNVQVFGERDPSRRGQVLFETRITFVNVDDAGANQPIES
jgi:acyl-CoA hydrolase